MVILCRLLTRALVFDFSIEDEEKKIFVKKRTFPPDVGGQLIQHPFII